MQSDTLAEDGEPAACAEETGCAEYEVQYADGPLDTSQNENNANARDDSTVDGTEEENLNQKPPAQQQSGTQESSNNQNQPNQQAPSWDKTKPAPDDPNKLGPDWKKNPQHRDPNGEQHINDKTGEKMEWNKGRPGQPRNRAKDHWHYTPPGGERGDHLKPGEVIKKTTIWTTIGLAIWNLIKAIPEMPIPE